MEELAPELVPMLTSMEMPANFVPMTNAVLAEMARRGIARDRILATLRRMGGEMPLGSLRLLQWAARAGIDIRILSDCNSLFIGHMLTGAPLSPFRCAPEAILRRLIYCSHGERRGLGCIASLGFLRCPSAPSLWL